MVVHEGDYVEVTLVNPATNNAIPKKPGREAGFNPERNCLAAILVFGDDRARTPPVEVIVQADANDMTVEAR
jgi:hypothetical protein